MAPKPRRARHQQTEWRPLTGVGTDDWQRQADAAAWSAISGLPPARFLGWLEPIPIPPDLQAKMREAGAALAAEPSATRADKLLRLAHIAVYGKEPPGTPLESPTEAAGAVSSDWWPAIPDEPQKAVSDAQNAEALAQRAEEAFAALQASEWTPEDDGEVPREQPKPENAEWWT